MGIGELKPYMLNGYASDDTVSSILAYLNAKIEDAGRTYTCVRCAGKGVIVKSLTTGNSGDTDLMECDSPYCRGYGKTVNQTKAPIVLGTDYVEVK